MFSFDVSGRVLKQARAPSGSEKGHLKGTEQGLPDLRVLWILFEALPTILGPNGAALILYHIGQKFAEAAITVSKECGLNPASTIEDLFQKSGLGWIEIGQVGCVAAIEERYSSLPVSGEGGFVSCYFVRGIFRQYLRHALGRDVEVQEKRCRAFGSSFCEFREKSGLL